LREQRVGLVVGGNLEWLGREDRGAGRLCTASEVYPAVALRRSCIKLTVVACKLNNVTQSRRYFIVVDEYF
jgi:hypothetical protein